MTWWRLARQPATYRTHWVLNPGPPHAKQVWVHWAAAPWLLGAMWHVPCIGGRCVHQSKKRSSRSNRRRGAARGMGTMDTLGFEPRAFRMRSGCDTTTPCALVAMIVQSNASMCHNLVAAAQPACDEQDALGFEPRAPRMRSRCGSTGPRGHGCLEAMWHVHCIGGCWLASCARLGTSGYAHLAKQPSR